MISFRWRQMETHMQAHLFVYGAGGALRRLFPREREVSRCSHPRQGFPITTAVNHHGEAADAGLSPVSSERRDNRCNIKQKRETV